MITVNVTTGELVAKAESNAPIPHSLARVVKKSCNLGLADGARAMFQGQGRGRGRGRFVKQPGASWQQIFKEKEEEEELGKDEELNEFLEGDGASVAMSGRFSSKASSVGQHASENETEMSGSSVSKVKWVEYSVEKAKRMSLQGKISSFLKSAEMDQAFSSSDKGGEGDRDGACLIRKASSTLSRAPSFGNISISDCGDVSRCDSPSSDTSQFSAVPVQPPENEQPLSIPPSIENLVYPTCKFEGEIKAGRSAPQKGSSKGKQSGYIMFLQHMRRMTGNTCSGSISDLIRTFDCDWKKLSEEERSMWKERAKTDGGRKASISLQRAKDPQEGQPVWQSASGRIPFPRPPAPAEGQTDDDYY